MAYPTTYPCLSLPHFGSLRPHSLRSLLRIMMACTISSLYVLCPFIAPCGPPFPKETVESVHTAKKAPNRDPYQQTRWQSGGKKDADHHDIV